MATGKTIDELNAATSVQPTDMLPAYQLGNSEAVKASVAQLAAAVGELNDQGAFGELKLATSMGKNQLATVLTNKGIPTEPSENLIAMADKVNSLNIEGQQGEIIAKNIWNYDGTISPQSRFCVFYNHLNGSRFIIIANTIYYIPESDDYANVADMLDAATFTFDMTTVDGSFSWENASYVRNNINVSEDFSKLIIPVAYTSTSAQTYIVVGFDSTNGFTHLHTIADKNLAYMYSNQMYGFPCCINDAGTHIAYATAANGSNAFHIYDIEHQQDYDFTDTLSPATSFSGVMSLMKNNAIYWVASSTGTAYSRLYKMSFSIDSSTGAVTFGQVKRTNEFYGTSAMYPVKFEWAHVPGQEGDPVLLVAGEGIFGASTYTMRSGPMLTTNVSSYPAGAFGFVRINTIRLTDDGTYDTKMTDFCITKSPYSGGNLSNTMPYIGCARILKIKRYDENTIVYTHPIFKTEIIINRKNGNITVEDIPVLMIFSNYSSNLGGSGLIWYVGKKIFQYTSNIYSNAAVIPSGTQYVYHVDSYDQGYLLGYIRPGSDGTQIIFSMVYGASDTPTMATLEPYKVGTTITPTPADGDGQTLLNSGPSTRNVQDGNNNNVAIN